MITRIRRWGNSLGLRIPKVLAEDVRLADGTPVDIRARNGNLIVTPVKWHKYSLGSLLADVRRSNIHEELGFGEAVGRETW